MDTVDFTFTVPVLHTIYFSLLLDKDTPPRMPTWWLKHVETCQRYIIQWCHRCVFHFTNCVQHKTYGH